MKMFPFSKIKQFSLKQYVLAGLLFLASISQYTIAEESVNWLYTIRPGDNLITLGKTHLVDPSDWKKLQRVNQLKNPHQIAVGGVLKVPVALLKQRPTAAEVMVVTGDAKLQKANKLQTLMVGQQLSAGAKLLTKDNSKVILRFADGSQIILTSNSTLVLDTLSVYSGGAMVDTRLRLQQGQMEINANPNHMPGNNMQIITPSAIAAVRGTKFRVSADLGSMKEETLEGKVGLVALGEEVSVVKGYGSFVEKGKPPITPVALLPAADLTQLQTQHTTLPISFDMPVMQRVVSWVGKVSPDTHFNAVVAEAEVQGKQLVFTDVPDGQYYLSVRAKDTLGLTGYDAVKQFEVNARPFAPVLVYPASKSIVRNAQPKLNWSAVPDADAYLLEIAHDAGFKKVVTKQRVATTTAQPNTALIPGQYFWRVASIDKTESGADDQGPFINASQFNYKALPAKPDISQLQTNVINNRVFVTLANPRDGLRYEASLTNKVNDQNNVWVGKDLAGQFDFPLKEYGPQTLLIKHTDSGGEAGPVTIYEFDAYPQ